MLLDTQRVMHVVSYVGDELTTVQVYKFVVKVIMAVCLVLLCLTRAQGMLMSLCMAAWIKTKIFYGLLRMCITG